MNIRLGGELLLMTYFDTIKVTLLFETINLKMGLIFVDLYANKPKSNQEIIGLHLTI